MNTDCALYLFQLSIEQLNTDTISKKRDKLISYYKGKQDNHSKNMRNMIHNAAQKLYDIYRNKLSLDDEAEEDFFHSPFNPIKHTSIKNNFAIFPFINAFDNIPFNQNAEQYSSSSQIVQSNGKLVRSSSKKKIFK